MESRQRSPTPSSEGAAYPLILEHVMKYPGSYEIPLRTMYELNLLPNPQQPMATPPSSAHSRGPTGNAFPSASYTSHPQASKHNGADAKDRAAVFKANLMSQIAQRPSQPCSSLPPSFITSFVRRCLPVALEEVEFGQALTVLDYLGKLETTRKMNYDSALKNLGVSEREDENGDLGRRYPGVSKWVDSIKNKNRLTLALYTQVYLRLRHWTLINEMMSTPFNKPNCDAMLNTLFPPISPPLPTPYLNEKKVNEHRAQFLRLIREFVARGTPALEPFIKWDKRPDDFTGWPAVRDIIENYLRVANEMIEECFDVNSRQPFEETTHVRKQNGRKVDSGISFGSADRPSTSSSSGSNKRNVSKPLPTPPADKQPQASGSTLERIAKEIRKIKSRPDLGEEVKETSDLHQPKTLKKARSARFLRSLGKKSDDESMNSTFDVDHFRRKRMEWEKTDQAKRSSS